MKKRILAILIAFAMIIQGIVTCSFSITYAEDIIYDGGGVVSIYNGNVAVIDENNTLWMWGYDLNVSYINRGNGYIKYKIMEDVNSVLVGYKATMAIKNDGSLWAWGNNNEGTVGDGTKERRVNPVKILDDVVFMDVGYPMYYWNYYYTVAAIKKDGSLWMWGFNEFGQVGDGTYENRTSPVKVLDDVLFVDTNRNATAAIKKDGSLWMWGNNKYGILGDGTTVIKNKPVKIMDDVASVKVKDFCTIAVKKDGSLWMWGSIKYDQIGTNVDNLYPVKIMDDVDSFSIGLDNVAVIKKDGGLFAWGNNEKGQLGDGITEKRHYPIKIMDDAKVVHIDLCNTAVLKKDGTLWMCGDNTWGQLGNGTKSSNQNFVKVLDDVIYMDKFNSYFWEDSIMMLAIKKDGSLWMWGDNNGGQIADGTQNNRLTPYQVPGIKIDPEMLKTSGYTAGENVYTEEVIVPTLPVSEIDNINSQATAEDAIKKALAAMTEEEKKTDVGIDTITHYGEVASHLATQKVVSGEIDLIAQIKELETQAMTAKTKTDGLLAGNGVETTRYVRSGVNLNTKENSFKIVVNNETVNSQIDMVRVNSIDYGITVEPKKLKEDVANEELVISVEKILPYNVKEGEIVVSMLGIFSGIYIGNKENVKLALSDDAQSKYKVTFSKETNENITLSLPLTAGDSIYQVIKKDGQAIASKYNPNTKKIEAKINQDGIYTVELNEKNFEDISNKSKEMQEAIKYLASKGIINGKSETTFDPDGEISRAEIAALITRSLSKLDPSVTNTFTDVKAGDWYYVAAISANKVGLFKGNENKQFLPINKIQKDQLTAVVSRVLVSEMGYKAPTDTTKYVTYVDAPSIQAWAVPEIALAARENLVIKRTDNTFNPTYKMTRGEAAVVLMRMFGKLW